MSTGVVCGRFVVQQ